MEKVTNMTIKVDKILYLDFEKEVIIADMKKRAAIEEALRDFVNKKKEDRK